jgi:hypothetical protein
MAGKVIALVSPALRGMPSEAKPSKDGFVAPFLAMTELIR